MKKILQWFVFLGFLALQVSVAQAKLNLFEQPRYIPAVSFYGDSGNGYKLSDFKEDLLIAVLWSRRCGPCLKDLKHLSAFAEKVRGSGIAIITISPENEWRTPDERRTFLARLGIRNLANYSDRQSRFRDGMGIRTTPTAILVDKNGEEIGQITGSIEWDNDKVIDKILVIRDESLKNLDNKKTAN
ncbi:MAG: TlpA family protein disulfide reductase [Alphaproteobacteria bacterium]|nr:TlpA family protein disulfide reductase [Alphaproteobacteria bacterium]